MYWEWSRPSPNISTTPCGAKVVGFAHCLPELGQEPWSSLSVMGCPSDRRGSFILDNRFFQEWRAVFEIAPQPTPLSLPSYQYCDGSVSSTLLDHLCAVPKI